jgi:hypothetical protein
MLILFVASLLIVVNCVRNSVAKKDDCLFAQPINAFCPSKKQRIKCIKACKDRPCEFNCLIRDTEETCKQVDLYNKLYDELCE